MALSPALLSLLLLLPLAAAQRFENEACGNGGRCKLLRDCPEAITALRQGKNPLICGFSGRQSIVCCEGPVQPATTRTTTSTALPPDKMADLPGAKSQRMCREYSKTVKVMQETPSLIGGETQYYEEDTCGQLEEPLIVGGQLAKGMEFPHMALVGFGDKSNIRYKCGGSIISEQHILSAAHCTDPANIGPARWARVGDLNTESDLDQAQPETLRITRRINHPRYSKGKHYNDIAIYVLERPLKFNAFVRPICLDTGAPLGETTAIATGWGHTEYGGPSSPDLRKVRVLYVDTAACNSSYRSSIKPGSSLNKGIVDSQLCAGEDGKDSCQGDSGGPLQTPLKDPYCMYLQVGITSFGKGCATAPGIYTRVSSYINWIESIVWP